MTPDARGSDDGSAGTVRAVLRSWSSASDGSIRPVAPSNERGLRRIGIPLAALGALAGVAALAFPAERTVLLALGGTGLLGGALAYYLTPERRVDAGAVERLLAAHDAATARAVAQFNLSGRRIYVPVETVDLPDVAPVVLFVPSRTVPSTLDQVERIGITSAPASIGLVTYPAGGALYPYVESMADEPPETVDAVCDLLADALVSVLEFVDAVDWHHAPPRSRVTFDVAGSALGSLDRLDHPVGSLLATGLAVVVGEPIDLAVDRSTESPGGCSLICRWDLDPEALGGPRVELPVTDSA